MDVDVLAAQLSPQRRSAQGDADPSRELKRLRLTPAPVKTLCDFCETHPEGRAMALLRPCDYKTISRNIIVECSNCANHRFSTSRPHSCVVSRRGRIAYRRYADSHPISYGGSKCDSCASTISKRGSCDVDVLLGYSCSECKNRECCVGSVRMETRPNIPLNEKRWFRHGCSTCHAMNQGKTTVVQGCSWLHNRLSWNDACDQCENHPCLCLDGGLAVQFAQAEPPKTWSLSRQETRGLVNLTNAGSWRLPCRWCIEQGEKCRASTLAPNNACNRCSVYGIDCIGRDGQLYPIFDLSHVGYGRIMTTEGCAPCLTTGRNCDRQRPCDSCVNHEEGELCNGQNDEHKRRFDQAPGPLYYLALGYGPLGVDDVKDGSRIEHWIGPPWPAYVTHGQDSKRWQSITTRMEVIRAGFLPEGKPPHGGPGGTLAHLQPSQITVGQLVDALKDAWPAAKPPREYFPDFDKRVANAKVRLTAQGTQRGSPPQHLEASISHPGPAATLSSVMSAERSSPAPAPAEPTLNQIPDGIEARHGINLDAIGTGLPPFTEAYEGERRFLALVRDDQPFVFDDRPVVPEIVHRRGEPQSLSSRHGPTSSRNGSNHEVIFVGETRRGQSSAAHILPQVPNVQQTGYHDPNTAMSRARHIREEDAVIWTVPEDAATAPGTLIREQRGQQHRRRPAVGPIDTRGDRRTVSLMPATQFHNYRYHHPQDLGPSPYDDEEARAVADIFMQQSVEQLRALGTKACEAESSVELTARDDNI